MADDGIVIKLLEEDITILKNLVEKLFADQTNISTAYLQKIKIFSYHLSAFLIEQLTAYKYQEKESVILFENLPYPRDTERQKTPTAIENVNGKSFSKDEIQMLLFASFIGDVFTWNSIQSSRLINHIIPIKENSNKLISSNSAIDFGLHTEDSFHNCAGDYLLLFGYRNETQVPTTVVYFNSLDLDTKTKAELFKKNFIIYPNLAHKVNKNEVRKTSILFGNVDSPYIRINLNSNKTLATTEKANKALETLKGAIEKNKKYLLIGNNQLAIIDNFRTLHGREKYSPKYDGFDRWLKRLYITRDLRKSAHLRKELSDNILMVK